VEEEILFEQYIVILVAVLFVIMVPGMPQGSTHESPGTEGFLAMEIGGITI